MGNVSHYASDKRCANFSLKMHLKRLAAGLRTDPLAALGELTALPTDPQLSRWLHWLSVELVIERSLVRLPAGALSSQLG